MRLGRAFLLAASLCLNFIFLSFIWKSKDLKEYQVVESSALPLLIDPKSLIKLEPQKAIWIPFDGTNFSAYIKDLKEAGFPQEVIQDIIIAEIERKYNEKRKELFSASGNGKWWTNPKFNSAEQMVLELRALDISKTKHEEYLKIFGFDPFVRKKKENQRFRDYSEWILSFLPEDKFFEAVHISDRYRALENGIVAQEYLDNVDVEEFFKLRDAKYRELQEFLSPYEFEEYKLGSSRLGDYMRAQFNGIEFTEQEFRQVFRLLEPYENALGSPDNGPAGNLAREQARKQSDNLVQMVLGPERFLDYHGVRDPYFNSTLSFVKREGASISEARKIYRIKLAVEDEIARVGSSNTGIRQSVESAVNEILGNEIFGRYTNTAGAAWMRVIGRETR